MKHIMVDLECLDSSNTPAIISLGAVYFDFAAGSLGEKFYCEVSLGGLKEQLSRGLTMSLETIYWWTQQSDEAREVWSPKLGKVTTEEMLNKFSGFCSRGENVRIWGNGATYDNIGLRNCYKVFGIKCPWKYQGDRCYRTVKNMFGNRAALDRSGTHHNALDDAVTQAEHLLAMTKGLKINE
jgi:exodeoxyribonuclease VIII